VQAQPLSLDEKCKKLEETIQRVATNTIGYTRKQAYKEWFDKECAEVNEEKNAAREQAIQNNTRGAKNAYKLAWTKERRLFRKKAIGLRDDGVDIDLPSREEKEGALKYLKNNKATGADSTSAELLKNGGPNLVDVLHPVIQQAWTGETLPRSWTEGVLCPVYKKGDKLDCKNYRGICLLNVTYKVFAKILYDRLLPHANAAVQHYQTGFQSGKSTTDQLFALRQILEKCNEFNITTHHLFIDFEAARPNLHN
jgi:hypothetical protein